MSAIDRFKSVIAGVKTVVITTHTYPDADGIGSQAALSLAFKEKDICTICVNEMPLLSKYKYLDLDEKIISYDEYIAEYELQTIDLFVVVDTSSLERVGDRVKHLAQKAKNILFIDHHPAPSEISRLHCIDTNMAATGELVGSLIQSIGVKLNKKIALPLYTSIVIDTSSFRYPTVTGNTHRLLAKLLDAGVKPPDAYNKIYGTKQISYMHLLGTILSSAKVNKTGEIGWLALSRSDIEKFNVTHEDVHGFINHLLILDNIKIACMFLELKNAVKVSFRSGDHNTNVGVIAQSLGGGGHSHSAATIVPGEFEEVIEKTVNNIEIILNGSNTLFIKQSVKHNS